MHSFTVAATTLAFAASALAAVVPTWKNHPVDVVLNRVWDGQAPGKELFPAKLQFAVDWNFETGKGNATMTHYNGVEVDFTKTNFKQHNMMPLGVKDQTDFMTSGSHWVYLNNGQKFYSYRIILDLIGKAPEFPEKTSAIMMGEEGNDIIVTENFS